ncbi:MAG: Uma2 family endonuclease [Oscillatoriales cyanobacterium C42_A2020_001]|nr:Uma2 family endonuclease [Leptolyngbyaceae cyanobacterium C42_A2020_001]
MELTELFYQGVSWHTYQVLLHELGDHRASRLAYVDITNPSSRKLSIYQQLGVPEVWQYVDQQVTIWQLQAGEYVACNASPTFPFVAADGLNQFLQQAEAQDDTALVRSWRKWVQEQIAT